MSAFSPENIAKAINRVPSTSTKDLQQLRLRAKEKGFDELVAAIDEELSLRGSIQLDGDAATQHALWAESTASLDLARAIEMAFLQVPASEEEQSLIREIFRNPGISCSALEDFRKKGDVGLYLGHMIHYRFGFFRGFLDGRKKISDLLFTREQISGRMTYRLTPDAEQAFKALRLV